jgi:glucose/mannose transport system substrate-binding protein
MRRLSITTMTALGLSTGAVLADPSVEVMHFWTSGGKAAALGAVRDRVVAGGVTWTDAPIAGGGGAIAAAK